MKMKFLGLCVLFLLSNAAFAQPTGRLEPRTPQGRGYYVPPQMIQLQLEWYGEWVTVAGVGRAWTPSVWSNWQPYYYGVWVWTDAYGWVWYSYEPWGYITYHYGRWWWTPEYGWVWIPGNEWSPGWVVWIEGPGYVSWAPLGPWNKPAGVIKGGGVVRGRPSVSKRNIRRPAWVTVSKESFRNGEYRYLSPKVVRKGFHQKKWAVEPPRVKPQRKMIKQIIRKRVLKGKEVFRKRFQERPLIKKTPKKTKHLEKKEQKKIKGVLKGG